MSSPSSDVAWGGEDLAQRALEAVNAISNAAVDDPLEALVYLVPFLVFAFTSWLLQRRSDDGRRGFFAYAFPRSVYLTRSTWVDLQIFVAGRLLSPLIATAGATATALLSAAIASTLSTWWPAWSGLLSGEGPAVTLAFTVGLALVYDLATWCSHLLHHRIPALWAIHSVHHSAEVLSPLTAFRHHPAYEVASRLLDVVLAGPLLGLWFFVVAGDVRAITVLGVNAIFVAFNLLGAGLRHSHMWLSFGPVLSRLVISPAQHQVHHSADPKHHDRNFGEVFAIWDWLFGTLYVPRERETLTFGLGEPHEHTSLWGAWILPIRDAVRALEGEGRAASEES